MVEKTQSRRHVTLSHKTICYLCLCPKERQLTDKSNINDQLHLSTKNLINPPPYPKEAKKGPTEKVRSSKHKPMMGFEPATYGLRNRCSTPELHRQDFLLYGISEDIPPRVNS